ncbi:hypothetical protein HDU88_002551 [Geranomyces variabilis]|nr:hypothetical protein HDU88_002551 [Geranomyces variabilis]
MDFVTHLPLTVWGYDGFWLISCKLTKRVDVYHYNATDNVIKVVDTFVNRYYPLHSIPKSIMVYHRQGDRQSNVDNQMVIRVLRSLANYKLDNWDLL